jgi:UDP-N-acetylglucosamine 4,6-dehydratase
MTDSQAARPVDMEWSKVSVLVTGGTGSFGKKFIDVMLRKHKPRRLIVFSRDELKQHEMLTGGYNDPCLRYFIGDVRDGERLKAALRGVDVVVHAAALKQVPACEYNPFEAIMTNVIGGKGVIDAALSCGVKRVLALSCSSKAIPTRAAWERASVASATATWSAAAAA